MLCYVILVCLGFQGLVEQTYTLARGIMGIVLRCSGVVAAAGWSGVPERAHSDLITLAVVG